MAGFNKEALAFANAHLEEQKQAIMDTLPYINHVFTSDASTGDPLAWDLLSDYILGIDGWATDFYGNTHTVSFKCRRPSEDYTVDLRLEAIKLTDDASRQNDCAGFMFRGERYAFDGFCSINCQTIDGKHYVFLGTEVMALQLYFGSDDNTLIKEIKEKYSKGKEGNEFFSGRYYVFIDAERFRSFIRWLAEHRAFYQCGQDADEETSDA